LALPSYLLAIRDDFDGDWNQNKTKAVVGTTTKLNGGVLRAGKKPSLG